MGSDSNEFVTVKKWPPISDFEVFRVGLPDNTSRNIMQIGQGPLRGTLTHLDPHGPVSAALGEFSQGLRACGIASDRRLTLGMVRDRRAVMQHCEVVPGDIIIVPPKQELYASYPGANGFASIQIGLEEVRAFAESRQPGAADAAIWRQKSVSVLTAAEDPDVAAARFAEFRNLLTAIRNPALSADEVDSYKERLLLLMTMPALSKLSKYRKPLLRLSVQRVRKAERFISDSSGVAAAREVLAKAGDAGPPQRVDIKAMCALLKVSPRQLRRDFTCVHGISPTEFLRRKLLNDVHAALWMGWDVHVKDVLRAFGLTDEDRYGRFAAEFREMFGENPRNTLRNAQP